MFFSIILCINRKYNYFGNPVNYQVVGMKAYWVSCTFTYIKHIDENQSDWYEMLVSAGDVATLVDRRGGKCQMIKKSDFGATSKVFGKIVKI